MVFGLAEGKVKIGQLKSNKPATLYSTEVYCAALATSPDGNGVVSAHADGTLYRFLFDDNGKIPNIFELNKLFWTSTRFLSHILKALINLTVGFAYVPHSDVRGRCQFL